MSDPGKFCQITVDGRQSFQTIDGFGVNINSKYWDGGRLAPTMDLLREDLGATLYRVDIWGKSNWIDPAGTVGPSALDEAHLSAIYSGDVFGRGWAMMRYLNDHGIEPFLTASGDVPAWMLAADGKTLADYDRFCDMLVSMVAWAKKREGLRFTLFSPMNETDIGTPEGPTVAPVDFVRVLEILDSKLTRAGLDNIRLVVADQAYFGSDYVREIVRSPKLVERIAVFGMHTYGLVPEERNQELVALVEDSPYRNRHLWMTEYGDLEQSGEREWWVAWQMTSRLFRQLEAGFNGAIAWDAYDNYHDHNEAWTIYGLLRTGLHVHTPKKRFYASKQIYRYVLPGFERVAIKCDAPELRLLAFASPDRSQFALVGMNDSAGALRPSVRLEGFDDRVGAGRVDYHRTSEAENCHRIGSLAVLNRSHPFRGIDPLIPPHTIFTLTTVKD